MITEQAANGALVERLRAAADALEFISNNRELLASVPEEDRERLLRLAGEVYMPDPAVRRHLLKTIKRGRIVERRQREEAILSGTGIRRMRRQPVYNTPNVFPPVEFEQHDVKDDPDFRETTEP